MKFTVTHCDSRLLILLNRQLRSGISNQLSELVVALRTDDRLCIVSEEAEKRTSDYLFSRIIQEA